MEKNEVLVCIFIGILTGLFFVIKYLKNKICIKQKKKKIKGKKKIFDLSSELEKEIENLGKIETKIIFNIIKINQNVDSFKSLKCDWLSEEIPINYKSNIELEYKENNNILMNEESHKISLILENNKKDFLIHIYNHQINIFNVYIDIFNEPTYSLEQIFYSKIINKFNKIKTNRKNILKKTIQIEDYKNENIMRCNEINITKAECINTFNYYSKFTNNNIFEEKNNNLYLNVYFNETKKSKIYLFLNDEYKTYEINQNDIEIINSFYDEFIKTKLYNNQDKDYYDRFYCFLERNYNENDLDDSQKKEEKCKNIIDINNNTTNKNDYNKNIEENIIKYIKFFENKCLLYLSYVISIKNNVKKEDIALCEKVCLLFISLLPDSKNKIKSFYHYKEEFISQNNFTLFEQISILISIKSFIFLNGNLSNLKLITYNDLPSSSPFIQGYLFYKSIIEKINIKSRITFIFNQFDSGSGFEYISNNECYKLKYIPLCIIKAHLLYNNISYFFIYENNDKKYAFTSGYSKDIFFNFFTLKMNKSDIYDINENLEMKLSLVYLHEFCHKKFRVFNSYKMKSPREFVKIDYELYINEYFEERYKEDDDTLLICEKSGESGKAIEYFLFNDNCVLDRLLKCDDLKLLKNVDLFIKEDNKQLNEIKEIILKKKNTKFIFDNFSSLTFSASKSFRNIKKIKLESGIEDEIIC